MYITVLKSKLHHLRVTDVELEYEGSLTVDPELLEAVGMVPYEKILIANLANGERFETYALEGERGSRRVCLNGATAHKGSAGDRLIVFAFVAMAPEEVSRHRPRIAVLDEHNQISGGTGSG